MAVREARRSTSASAASSPWKSWNRGWSFAYVPFGSRRYDTSASRDPTPGGGFAPRGGWRRRRAPWRARARASAILARVLVFVALLRRELAEDRGGESDVSLFAVEAEDAGVRAPGVCAGAAEISKKRCPPDVDAAPADCRPRQADGGRTILSSARARMPFAAAASLRTPSRRASQATPSLLARMCSARARASASRCFASARSRRSASSRALRRASAAAAARRSAACLRCRSALRLSCSRLSLSAAALRNIARARTARLPVGPGSQIRRGGTARDDVYLVLFRAGGCRVFAILDGD